MIISKIHRGFFIFVSSLVLLSLNNLLYANSMSKIGPTVLKEIKKNPHQKLSVILYLKEQANLTYSRKLVTREEKGNFVYKALTKTAKSTQGPLVKWLTNKKIHFQRFYIVNAIALFEVRADAITKLAKREDIAKIILNPKFRFLPETNFTDYIFSRTPSVEKGVGANIVSTGAERVWNEFNVKGEGIVVAGQDTGVDWNHPALNRQYRGSNSDGTFDHSYSWHDSIKRPIGTDSNSCGYNLSVPCDDNGHGTHTVGTMVGDDGQENRIGMAPNAKWIACRNMDSGLGQPSTYIECFEWFLAPYPQGSDQMMAGRPEKAPHVINNSWGCPTEEGCHEAEILPVLKSLKSAGIMVVVSAGNDGSQCKTINSPPAMHSEETLSVGAHDHASGRIASFSSRGPSTYDNQIGPDVTAPGVAIRSSIPGGNYQGSFWSGTSMAGPHVAGQVALLWSANKNLIGNIEETIRIIRSSATAKTTSESCGGVAGSKIPNNTYGHGLINVYKAVLKNSFSPNAF